MTTLLLRIVVASIAASVIAATAIAIFTGSLMAAGIATLIASINAIVLAFEFALMWRINCSEAPPHPSVRQVISAWCHECTASVRVFGWNQPCRAGKWDDVTSLNSRGRRGVVLIHGFACNRGIWNNWLARLHAANVPTVAVNLNPPWGPIELYTASIDEAVSRLEQLTGLAPVLVAHSMGGLAARYWRTCVAQPDRAHHLITLGTPHNGTWLARLGLGLNVRQMRIGSAWLRSLAERESGLGPIRMTCYYSHCDNVVFPASTATLAGADHRHLEACAHVQMVDRPEPWRELLSYVAESGAQRAE